MKRRMFNVPADLIVEFAQLIEKHELENSVIGATDDDEITLEVFYERGEKKIMHELQDLIDDYDDDE